MSLHLELFFSQFYLFIYDPSSPKQTFINATLKGYKWNKTSHSLHLKREIQRLKGEVVKGLII